MPDPKLTEADVLELRDVRDDIKVAVNDRKAAIRRRAALLRRLRSQGVGVTEMARHVGLHRSQVNRIVTGAPTNEQD